MTRPIYKLTPLCLTVNVSKEEYIARKVEHMMQQNPRADREYCEHLAEGIWKLRIDWVESSKKERK